MKQTAASALRRFLILLLLGWGGTSFVHAVDTDDVTITVTPVADVSLSLDVTTYAFGAIDVNTSTASATALRLTNSGQVSIAVDKRIATESSPAGWTAAATAGRDTYALYCATSTVALSLGSYGGASLFGAQGDITSLTGPYGAQPILTPQGGSSFVDLWFRLDMPTNVSSLTSRTITVRFTGTAQ